MVEESPSPAVDHSLRLEMGKVALKVVKTVNYRNAGTVEFLVDHNRNFYFMEVNPRIQVEHPVTEMVTALISLRNKSAWPRGCPYDFARKTFVSTGTVFNVGSTPSVQRLCPESRDGDPVSRSGRTGDSGGYGPGRPRATFITSMTP